MHGFAPKQKSPSPAARPMSRAPERRADIAAPQPTESAKRGGEPAAFHAHPVFAHGLIQPRLTIGASNDPLEQEADRIAEQVTGTAEPQARGAASSEQPPGAIRLRATSAHSGGIDAPPIVHGVLKRPGQPLDPTTRAFVEPRFGKDFSDVRVHVGAHAAEAASAIAARAFTTGRDIVFGAGEYAPRAASGLKLLAHELAHVSQQGAGRDQATIRRFESDEHKKIGDEVTKQNGTDMMVVLSPYFKCTFGDMTAMAGDFFGTLKEMKALAAVDGTTPGTVAELKYARDVGVRKQKDTYDSSVKEAVGKRANKLVLGNVDHFSNPKLEDRKKPHEQKATQDRNLPPGNAPAGYRREHDEAIMAALYGGRFKGEAPEASWDIAKQHESFASHFLSDGFSAGHVRVARKTVTDYWNAKLPMFDTNMYGWMAETIVFAVVKRVAILSKVPLPLPLYKMILDTLPALVPKSGLGDVVAGALHDYDSEKGLKVTSGKQVVTIKGDDNLDTVTKELAVRALKFSLGEVGEAYKYGLTQAGQDWSKWEPAGQYAETKLKTGGLYAAEQIWPVVHKDENAKEPIWKKNTIAELFDDPNMAEAFAVFGRKKAHNIKESILELEWLKTIFGVDDGLRILVDSLNGGAAKVKTTLERIADWTPGIFAVTPNTDYSAQNAYEYYVEARGRKGGLSSLSIKQRENLIAPVASPPISAKHASMIFDILEHTSPGDLVGVFSGINYATIDSGLSAEDKVKFKEKYGKFRIITHDSSGKAALGPFLLPEVVVVAAYSGLVSPPREAAVIDKTRFARDPVKIPPMSTNSAAGAAAFKLNAFLGESIQASVKFSNAATFGEASYRAKVLNEQLYKAVQDAVLHPRDILTSPEIEWQQKVKEAEEGQKILKDAFGEYGGMFFWAMRGGGQTEEGSTLWMFLDAFEGVPGAGVPKYRHVPSSGSSK